MRKPTIHLNGTGVDSLLDGYRDAMDAVQDAIDKLTEATPNARDYYVQADGAAAWIEARNEHYARAAKLEDVRKELEELALHCLDVKAERDATRARQAAAR